MQATHILTLITHHYGFNTTAWLEKRDDNRCTRKSSHPIYLPTYLQAGR